MASEEGNYRVPKWFWGLPILAVAIIAFAAAFILHSKSGNETSAKPSAAPATAPAKPPPPVLAVALPERERLPFFYPSFLSILSYPLWDGKNADYQLKDSAWAVDAIHSKSTPSPTTRPAMELEKIGPAMIKVVQSFRFDGKYRGFMAKDLSDGPELLAIDGKLIALFPNVYSDNIYNTLRTTAKSRAAKEIQEHGFDLLRDIHSGLGDTAVDQYGLEITYGSRDFGEENSRRNGEGVLIVTPKALFVRFIEGKITDQQFVSESEIYSVDFVQRTRIAITLE